MRLPRECYQMAGHSHLPDLTQSQLTGLAWWVWGPSWPGAPARSPPSPPGATGTTWPVSPGVVVRRRRPGASLQDRTGREPLLRAAAEMGPGLVEFRPAGPGGGPHVERGRNHCHRHQRGLPELRHSRGLAHPPSHPARVLDGPDSGTAAGPGPGGAQGNDRGGAVRPGPGQSEVVETDTGSRVASLHEVSEKHHFLCPGRPQAAGASLRPPAGYGLDRSGYRFRHRRRQTPLHPAGGLVRRAGGAVGHIDRPSSGGQGPAPALLDRTGLQGPKSLGWKWDKTRRTDPARVPATGSCSRWPRCLPWPMVPGWKTPMTAGLPQATCGRRPGRCRPSIAAVGRSRDGGSA